MPLNSPTNDDTAGTLYVVATPIGNMDDISLRALNIIKNADTVAAEDTRHTGKLLARHQIKSHLISYHEHNERERTALLIKKLKEGSSIALVSNAGTPSVSDPGYRLVQEAIATGIRVVPVPGANAAIAALSVSGLPTDSFTFIGFLPKKRGKRLALLESLSIEPRTMIFYESPRRIVFLIEEIKDIMGDRFGVLSREMTKIHEEFIRGPLSKILKQLGERDHVKGECTLLLKGQDETNDEESSRMFLRRELQEVLENQQKRLSELVKEMAKKFGLPRNVVYEEAIQIKAKVRDRRSGERSKR